MPLAVSHRNSSISLDDCVVDAADEDDPSLAVCLAGRIPVRSCVGSGLELRYPFLFLMAALSWSMHVGCGTLLRAAELCFERGDQDNEHFLMAYAWVTRLHAW